jgi:hypothetical protein
MRKALVLGLLVAGCSGAPTSFRAVASPDRSPRWIQSSADGRVVAFTEVKDKGADRLVITGRPTSTYHFL